MSVLHHRRRFAQAFALDRMHLIVAAAAIAIVAVAAWISAWPAVSLATRGPLSLARLASSRAHPCPN